MTELISIKGLKVDLMTTGGLVHAVRSIDLDISSGEIHGIVGESGCGKTMTAKSILRLHDEKKTD
jgi:ABC-type dipeptide/oligopeptide/nickel transport system ATPase component